MKTPIWPIIWSSETHRVDLDTGEPLTKYEAAKYYTKIKQEEHVEINQNRTRGHVTRTIGYRRKLLLFPTD